LHNGIFFIDELSTSQAAEFIVQQLKDDDHPIPSWVNQAEPKPGFGALRVLPSLSFLSLRISVSLTAATGNRFSFQFDACEL
jgi:hypothetical protein